MSYFVMLAVGRRASGEAFMAPIVGVGEDLAAFASENLADLEEKHGTPVMVLWAGDHDVIEMAHAPDLPIEFPIDDMLTRAVELQTVTVAEMVPVDLPEEEPQGVYFGLIGIELGPALQEVAVAADSLASAVQAVFEQTRNVWQLHGLSDASLADDQATFAGKPLALASMFVKQGTPGQVHFGDTIGDEDYDDSA